MKKDIADGLKAGHKNVSQKSLLLRAHSEENLVIVSLLLPTRFFVLSIDFKKTFGTINRRSSLEMAKLSWF